MGLISFKISLSELLWRLPSSLSDHHRTSNSGHSFRECRRAVCRRPALSPGPHAPPRAATRLCSNLRVKSTRRPTGLQYSHRRSQSTDRRFSPSTGHFLSAREPTCHPTQPRAAAHQSSDLCNFKGWISYIISLKLN